MLCWERVICKNTRRCCFIASNSIIESNEQRNWSILDSKVSCTSEIYYPNKILIFFDSFKRSLNWPEYKQILVRDSYSVLIIMFYLSDCIQIKQWSIWNSIIGVLLIDSKGKNSITYASKPRILTKSASIVIREIHFWRKILISAFYIQSFNDKICFCLLK